MQDRLVHSLGRKQHGPPYVDAVDVEDQVHLAGRDAFLAQVGKACQRR